MKKESAPSLACPYIIGIAGPSGSGKTTLAKTLHQYFKDNIAVLYLDNYYNANWDIPMANRIQQNYDEPSAFDMDLLFQQLQMLRCNQAIEEPVYDFSQHERCTENTTTVHPKKIIVIEGILLLHMAEIRTLLDLKIFIDTPVDECKKRRLARDCSERGRDAASALEQYQKTVHPMLIKHVLPSKAHADLSFEMMPGFEQRTPFQKLVAHINALPSI